MAAATVHVQGSFVFYSGIVQVPPFIQAERALTVVFRGCQHVTHLLRASVQHELEILKHVGGHSNIMWLLDVVSTYPNPPTLIFDHKCLMPMLPLVSKKERVRQTHFLFLQMTSALAHLATLNVVHSNIHAGTIQMAAFNKEHSMWWFRLTGFNHAIMENTVIVVNDAPQRWILPPECNKVTQFVASPTMDVWQLGMVLLLHLQNEHAPDESIGCVKKMVVEDPKQRPCALELQKDTYRRPVASYILHRVLTKTSMEQELADAIASSTNLADEICADNMPAYKQTGPSLSLDMGVVQTMQAEYFLVTLEQLAAAAFALQMFISKHKPGGSSLVTDAASEDSQELWHVLSLLRTICLESNIVARQNISVYVLWELQPDIFALRKELESGIVTSELILYVRNVDHLLAYFYRCACAWEHNGRPAATRHPRAQIIEAAVQRRDAACQHKCIEEWAVAAKKDANLLLQRFNI
jgi:hypothetical protein